MNSKTLDNAYAYSFTALDSNTPVPLPDFQGKVILVVNTASKCGFTKQYAQLEALYQRFKDKGLVIIGIPSNNFGHQEPGSSGDIASFCSVKYGVNFPMVNKEDVIGKNAHPFYQWARKKLGFIAAPKWNFHKYLIDKNGQLVDYFYSTTSPDAPRVIAAIERLLA